MLGVGLLSACGGGDGGGERIDFERETLEGATLRLSDFRGGYVLVNFWATWCGPCLAEMPDLEAISHDYADHGLTVVGISIDDAPASVVAAFAERMGVSYPIVQDPADLQQLFGDLFAVPTTFLVDTRGRIELRMTGAFDPAALRAHLDDLLDVPSP